MIPKRRIIKLEDRVTLLSNKVNTFIKQHECEHSNIEFIENNCSTKVCKDCGLVLEQYYSVSGWQKFVKERAKYYTDAAKGY